MVKTSLDPTTVVRGTELLAKLEQVDRDKRQEPNDDGFLMWRLERDFLLQRNGAVAFILMHGISNLHLLHDTHSMVMKQQFGPEVWNASYASLNNDARKDLDAKLADRTWQAEARAKIWGEIGIDITKVTQAA